MCPPVIAAIAAAPMFSASLAMSVVQGVMGYVGAQQQADAQYDAQVANQTATRQAAITDMVAQGDDINQRGMQERASTALNVNNARLQAMRVASTANASSEAAGMSVDMLMSDYDRQYLNYADAQMMQLGWGEEQLTRSREALTAQAQGRINSVPSTPVVYPGLGGTLIGIGASGLSAFNTYSTRDPISGNYTLG